MDWGSLGVLVADSVSKIKSVPIEVKSDFFFLIFFLKFLRQGFDFYGEGTKILLNDLQYAWYLIIKAVQGYTLKPRFAY